MVETPFLLLRRRWQRAWRRYTLLTSKILSVASRIVKIIGKPRLNYVGWRMAADHL
jgi:hypothetical protein